jgi:hypothetical protein
MSRKQKAIQYFIPAVLGHWGKFMKHLMAFSEMRYADDVVAKMGFENSLPSVDLLDLAPNLQEELTSMTFLDMTSRVIDMVFMKAMARRFNGLCDYLEIGSWRGESLINMASVCKSVVSVTLSREEMREMKMDARMIELEGFFLKPEMNIKRIGHNSMTFDFSSLNQKFDLIFVDGGHDFESVKSDTINAFKLLKDENSIIIWHDCGYSYEDKRNEVIAAILTGANAEQQKHIYRVSNTLCGIYINGKFETSFTGTITAPNKVFEVSIKGKKLAE